MGTKVNRESPSVTLLYLDFNLKGQCNREVYTNWCLAPVGNSREHHVAILWLAKYKLFHQIITLEGPSWVFRDPKSISLQFTYQILI